MKQLKQYIENYNLGFYTNEFKNDKHYIYILNYKRHGFFISLSFLNNYNYIYKGYYNMNKLYSHWIDNYQKQSFFKYYL